MYSDNKRIAKNTIMLYMRQIFIILVNIYTVRVVLNTLGVEDYGIYNVTAGAVAMFSFLNGSMANASQRYFSFEIGRGNFKQLQKIFSLSFLIYIMIIALVFLLAETLGLWFVNNKLTIPPERIFAAQWLYQFSIISLIFKILATPYMAAIIAHEDMGIYAYISIIETVFNLGSVFLLQYFVLDRLQLYGAFICIVAFINSAIYFVICRIKYNECKFMFYWNKELYKEIASYTCWNLFGASVGIFKNQAINILLNQFFNPMVVAVRSIASYVNSGTVTFSQNFSTAMRPQIFKTFAIGQIEKTLHLMLQGTKGTYFLVYLVALPLLLETPFVLFLWLKNPPENAVLFTRLALIDALIESASYPISMVAQATGKVKLYQSIVGGLLILNLPISWIALAFGALPHIVMIIAVIITFLAFIVRLFLVKRLVYFSLIGFMKKVLFPICAVSLLSAILPVIISANTQTNMASFVVIIVFSVISSCVCMYMIGLNKMERLQLNNAIKNRSW